MTHSYYTEEEIRIPDIVEQKCQAAYDQIRKEAAQDSRKKHWSMKKTASVISVAAAAAVSLSFALPAVAQSGMLQNIFDYFSSGNTYAADPTQKNNLQSYACAIDMTQSADNAVVTLQDVYFDGENICWTMLMQNVPEEIQDSTNIAVYYEAFLGDQKLEIRSSDFKAMGDGNFASSMSAKYEGDAAETLPLKISFTKYDAYNFNYFVLGTDKVYAPKSTYQIPLEMTFEVDVTARTDMNRVYKVDQTNNGFTLETVTVTPFSTMLKISGDFTPHEKVTMTDQNGVEYESVWDGAQTDDQSSVSFEAALKTTKQLHIAVIDEAQDGLPTMASFTVDIEPGTRTAAAAPQHQTAEVIYDPPLEENADDAEDTCTYRSAEKITFPNESNMDKTLDVMVLPTKWTKDHHQLDTMTVVPEKAYLADKSEIKALVNTYQGGENYNTELTYFFDGYDQEHLELLLVDYTITNDCSYDCELCIDSLSIAGKDGTYPISGLTVVYCSEQDYGGEMYNLYNFTPGETRTLTVGYLVTGESVEKGYCLFDSGRGTTPLNQANSNACIIPDITD